MTYIKYFVQEGSCRYILSGSLLGVESVGEVGRFDRLTDEFLWLKEAGEAIPAINVEEPKLLQGWGRNAGAEVKGR